MLKFAEIRWGQAASNISHEGLFFRVALSLCGSEGRRVSEGEACPPRVACLRSRSHVAAVPTNVGVLVEFTTCRRQVLRLSARVTVCPRPPGSSIRRRRRPRVAAAPEGWPLPRCALRRVVCSQPGLRPVCLRFPRTAALSPCSFVRAGFTWMPFMMCRG